MASQKKKIGSVLMVTTALVGCNFESEGEPAGEHNQHEGSGEQFVGEVWYVGTGGASISSRPPEVQGVDPRDGMGGMGGMGGTDSSDE